VLVGSGHGYQFGFRLRCWVGLGWQINWISIGVLGLCTRLPVGYLLHTLELIKYWPLPVLTGSGLCTLVTSWSRSVFLFTGNSTVRSGASSWDQTGRVWTGLDWTHNPHPPWLGLSKVTPCEQGVPEVSAPHVRRRALTSGMSCSLCLALWAYYPV
jgi:hypothetical protein